MNDKPPTHPLVAELPALSAHDISCTVKVANRDSTDQIKEGMLADHTISCSQPPLLPLSSFPHEITYEQSDAIANYRTSYRSLSAKEKKLMDAQIALTDRFSSMGIKIAVLKEAFNPSAGLAIVDHSKSGPRTVVKNTTNPLATKLLEQHNQPPLFNNDTDALLRSGVYRASFRPEGGQPAHKKSRVTGSQSQSYWKSSDWSSSHAASSSSSSWRENW
jgi:hypothetical protein